MMIGPLFYGFIVCMFISFLFEPVLKFHQLPPQTQKENNFSENYEKFTRFQHDTAHTLCANHTVKLRCMFRSEADLRAFAEKVFAHYAEHDTLKGGEKSEGNVLHHPQRSPRHSSSSSTSSFLTPQSYYFAYMTVFGVAPSTDEVSLLFLRCNASGGTSPPRSGDTAGRGAEVGDRHATAPSPPSERNRAASTSTSPLVSMERRMEESLSRLEAKSHAAVSASIGGPPIHGSSSSSSSSRSYCSREQFLNRVVEKYTLLHGPFRVAMMRLGGGDGAGGEERGQSREKETAAESSGLVGQLWAVFDALDTEQKGYFSLADVEMAVRRSNFVAAKRKNGDQSLKASDEQQQHLPPLSHADKVYLQSVFTLCDGDHDGRITFEQFKAIYCS